MVFQTCACVRKNASTVGRWQRFSNPCCACLVKRKCSSRIITWVRSDIAVEGRIAQLPAVRPHSKGLNNSLAHSHNVDGTRNPFASVNCICRRTLEPIGQCSFFSSAIDENISTLVDACEVARNTTTARTIEPQLYFYNKRRSMNSSL